MCYTMYLARVSAMDLGRLLANFRKELDKRPLPSKSRVRIALKYQQQLALLFATHFSTAVVSRSFWRKVCARAGQAASGLGRRGGRRGRGVRVCGAVRRWT